MPYGLELRVRKTIRDFNMLAGGEHVLVAVSGGADSTALLLCLHKLAPGLRLTLTVAHLNHGIRGTEADADEAFVRRLSASLELPFISESADIKRQAEAEKRNLEELARERRYEFLERTAHRAGANRIAVGHTLNDQAETALFRLIRGSGIEGLSAIHPVVSGVLIRPLLQCARNSILEFLKQEGIGYREDATNRDLRFARNRIRGELIPYLEKNFNPKVVQALAREASLAGETWSYIESQASRLFGEIHSREGGNIALKAADLRNVHPALRKQVLRLGLRECIGSLHGIGSIHIQGILDLLENRQSGARIQLPRGITVTRQFGAIVLSQAPPKATPSFEYALPIPGTCPIAEAGVVIESGITSPPGLQTMKGCYSAEAYLEPTVLPQTLTIRSRLAGDRYGGPGHRKVKKMLIDSRIPSPQRSLLPMIVVGDSVVWVPGFRPARGFEVRPNSTKCVCIRVKNLSGPLD